MHCETDKSNTESVPDPTFCEGLATPDYPWAWQIAKHTDMKIKIPSPSMIFTTRVTSSLKPRPWLLGQGLGMRLGNEVWYHTLSLSYPRALTSGHYLESYFCILYTSSVLVVLYISATLLPSMHLREPTVVGVQKFSFSDIHIASCVDRPKSTAIVHVHVLDQ